MKIQIQSKSSLKEKIFENVKSYTFKDKHTFIMRTDTSNIEINLDKFNVFQIKED